MNSSRISSVVWLTDIEGRGLVARHYERTQSACGQRRGASSSTLCSLFVSVSRAPLVARENAAINDGAGQGSRVGKGRRVRMRLCRRVGHDQYISDAAR